MQIIYPVPRLGNVTTKVETALADILQWLAPAIRLECRWKWPGDDDGLQLSLGFHFNSLNAGVDGIKRSFRVEKDVRNGDTIADEMVFTCSEAACEGFNRVEKYRKRLGSQGMQLYGKWTSSASATCEFFATWV